MERSLDFSLPIFRLKDTFPKLFKISKFSIILESSIISNFTHDRAFNDFGCNQIKKLNFYSQDSIFAGNIGRRMSTF